MGYALSWKIDPLECNCTGSRETGRKRKPLKGFPIRAVSLYWSERRGAQQQLKQAGTGCELLVKFRMGGFFETFPPLSA